MRWNPARVGLGLGMIAAGLGVWWLVADHESTGCGADAGPTAVVAVRSSDGEVLWNRRLGHVQDVTVGDRTTLVEARTHDTTIQTATGEIISCVEHTPPEELDTAVTTTAAPAASQDVYDLWESADEHDIFVAREPIYDEGHERARIAVRAKDGAPLWDAVMPSFEMYVIADRLVVITGVAAIYAVDFESGDFRWETELGNPGRGGRFSEQAYVSELVPDETLGIVLAGVTATEPYND